MERNIVGEERILAGLRAAFGASALTVHGRNNVGPGAGVNQRYDLEGGRETFADARVLIGPHGAAFCNVLLTKKAAMVLLPICDAVGCPAAQVPHQHARDVACSRGVLTWRAHVACFRGVLPWRDGVA